MKRKNKLLKIAINLLEMYGTERLTIPSLAEAMQVDTGTLSPRYFADDRELLMDTVDAAGRIWVAQIRKKADAAADRKGKIAVFANGYVTGSKAHSNILSTYIDLWKLVKDKKDPYIKKRLGQIYEFYMAAFKSFMQEVAQHNDEELEALSVLATVLSDALHIQSIVLEKAIDFDGIQKLVEKIIDLFILNGGR